ncbi:MAG: type II secretion system F family protein [Planctomycetota bacterium]
MTTYQYIAKTNGGEQVTGSLQADNEAAAARSLREKSLFPVQVSPKADGLIRRGGGRVRMRDMATLYMQLSDLMGSGVPLLHAIRTLARATTRPKLVKVLTKLHENVSEGQTLAESMAEHPEVFPSLHVAMVRAGERAGFLEDVFANLGTFLERQDELRSKVVGALIYPLILALLGSAVTVFVLVVLVPQFEGVFQEMSLPLATHMLFGASSVLRDYGLLLAGALIVGGVAVVSAVRSPVGRRTWSRWQLKVPVLGGVLRSLYVTRFCRILGTLLANGVPILQAMAISKDAAGNVMFAETIAEASESVKQGESLAEPLRSSGLFPPEILEMVAVAEESNKLDVVLVEIADRVERRTNRAVDTAVRLIEPLMLVVMAAAIGFAAFGLLYPIFTMSRTLQ